MLFNIPTRSNPMPYYTTPQSGPDYQNMPLTFAPISSNASILCNRYSTSPNQTYYYNKNGTGWVQYSWGSAIQLNYSNGDYVSFSGTTDYFGVQGSQYNPFTFSGSAPIKVLGNVHSLINYGTLSNYKFRGLFRGAPNIIDFSKMFLPFPSGYNSSGLYSSAFRSAGAKILPKLRNLNFDYLPDHTFDAMGYSSNSIRVLEVAFTTRTQGTDNFNEFLHADLNYSDGIWIKPKDYPLDKTGNNTNTHGKIPSNWLVLNRIGGKLYYAEQGDGTNVPYTGEDPYEGVK